MPPYFKVPDTLNGNREVLLSSRFVVAGAFRFPLKVPTHILAFSGTLRKDVHLPDAHFLARLKGPFPGADLEVHKRRAQWQSRMARLGHRVAARSVLYGREHDATLHTGRGLAINTARCT